MYLFLRSGHEIFSGDEVEIAGSPIKLAHEILAYVTELWQNMTPSKWTTLISYGLALVGFGVWLSERKWEDAHRNEGQKRWMRLGRTCWCLGLMALGVAVFYSISQKEKKPHYAVYLNNLPLGNEEETYLTFPPATNQFIVSVFNDGNSPAEKLRLLVTFAPSPNILIKSAEGWRPTTSFTPNKFPAQPNPVQQTYVVEDEETYLEPGDAFTAPAIAFGHVDSLNIFRLRISAKNLPYVYKTVALHYKIGIEKPYLGY